MDRWMDGHVLDVRFSSFIWYRVPHKWRK